MSSKIIGAYKATNGYHFLIHLDTEAMIPDPEHADPEKAPLVPDPLWVHEITFGPLQPSEKPFHEDGGHDETGAFHHHCVTQHGKDLTEEEYLKNITEQIPPMVELELHRRQGTTHHHASREVIRALHGKEF